MILGFPKVLGPLSECSRSVRVQALFDGAKIEIFADDDLVAKDIAKYSDQVFDLLPTAILKPGQAMTAVQILGSDSSPDHRSYPYPIHVQKKPSNLSPLVFSTPVYACANCLRVYGALPGATVTVTANGSFRGEGVAVNGTAFVQLNNSLLKTELVEATQSASAPPCSITSPSAAIGINPDDTPLIGPKQLPTPMIVEPIKNCVETVTVGNVVPGANMAVTLERTNGSTISFSKCCFAGQIPLDVPILDKGDVFIAEQEMIPRCELKSDVSKAVVIEASPDKPVIQSPICTGAGYVTIGNLEPKKLVKIFQDNGSEPLLCRAYDKVCTFLVPPINGNKIWATQELCGVWSDSSNVVSVDPQPTSIPQPEIPGDHFKCGTVVRVTNIRPGSYVEIWSDNKKAQINTSYCQNIIYDTWVDICVSPLEKDDFIWAVVYSCGMPAKSVKDKVKDFGDLGSPRVAKPIGVCMTSVVVEQVIPGAVVDVYVQRGGSTPKWCGSATAGTDSVEVPIKSCQLQAGDFVMARQRLCDQRTRLGVASEVTAKSTSVVTQHNDNARTGANLNEVVLNVNSIKKDRFRLLFRRFTDGQIYSQPLYVCGVDVPKKGHRNVIYVATMHNTVYAFDADDPAEYNPLWQVSLGLPIKLPNSRLGAIPNFPGHINYNDIDIEIGITSTPVIDPDSKTLYVVAYSDDGWQKNPITNQMEYKEGIYNYHLHALDITTGQDKPGSPVAIEGSYPGTKNNTDITISFDSVQQLQCSALLLSQGKVYVAFTGFDYNLDKHPYHGWVISFDAKTLIRAEVFNTTPMEPFERTSSYVRGGGIWQTGQGPAADSEGDIYFTTGIGGLDYGPGLSSSLLILTKDLQFSSSFLPSSSIKGSSGPLLLPGIDSHNLNTTYAFFGGKWGWAYLVDKNEIGLNIGMAPDPGAAQSFYVAISKHIHGGAVYWDGPNGPHVYLWPEGDFLRSYKLDGGKFQLTTSGSPPPDAIPESKSLISAPPSSMPGGMISISAMHNIPDSGVVWAVVPIQPNAQRMSVPGILRAFDASDVSIELWNSDMDQSGHDGLGYMAKTCPPTVANGKVYVATWSGNLAVYGLRPP